MAEQQKPLLLEPPVMQPSKGYINFMRRLTQTVARASQPLIHEASIHDPAAEGDGRVIGRKTVLFEEPNALLLTAATYDLDAAGYVATRLADDEGIALAHPTAMVSVAAERGGVWMFGSTYLSSDRQPVTTLGAHIPKPLDATSDAGRFCWDTAKSYGFGDAWVENTFDRAASKQPFVQRAAVMSLAQLAIFQNSIGPRLDQI